MYTQLVNPNLDIKVVYENGKPLTSWLGYCLAVAESMCNAPRVGGTAWQAWTQLTQLPHTDALPTGVYVPVWFSGYGGQGHVCIYKDGTCWSSPYTNKTKLDVVPFSQMSQKYAGIQYVGWSEDMVGLEIVTEGGDMHPSRERVKAVFEAYLGKKNLTEADYAYWTNQTSEFLDDSCASERFAIDAAKIKALEAGSQYVKVTDLYIKK